MSPLMVSTWALALKAIALFLIVHLALARIFRLEDPFKPLNRLFLVFVVGVFYAAKTRLPAIPASPQPIAMQAAVLLTFLFLAYLSLYALIIHAVRVRIAMEICQSPVRPMPISELLRRFDPGREALRRLNELVDTGCMRKDGDHYRLTRKGACLARLTIALKNVFNVPLEPGGPSS